MAVITVIAGVFAQQTGDIVTIGEKRYQLTGDNLIPNAGFEESMTGWTDGTAVNEITSDNFTLTSGGGVDGSVGLYSMQSTGIGGTGSIATGWAIESEKTYYFSFYVKHQDPESEEENAQYLKVSLTNDIVNQAEPLYVLNGSKVGANGEWTKNEAAFTNSDNYGFIIARFRWLSAIFAFDNFALFTVTELPNPTALQAVIAEAEGIYDVSKAGAANLLAAINTAKTFLSSTSISDMEQAIVDLRAAIFTYRVLNASDANPLDLTGLITNPNFESNFEGWTNNGMQTQTNTSFTLKDGNVYVEKWVADSEGNNVPDVSVQQTVTGLPNGSYTLTVSAQNIRQSTGAQQGGYIFAASAETEVGDMDDYSVNFVVADGTVTLGFKTESSTANWVACDNYRLTYTGVNLQALRAELSRQVDEANTLTSYKMQSTVATELSAAITAATAVVMNGSSTEAQISAAATQLSVAVAAARPSIVAYTALRTAIDAANAVKTEYSYLPGVNTFETIINAAEATYTAGSADEAGVETIIAGLRQAALNFRLSADTPCDATVAIANPDFEEEYTEFAKPNSDRAIYQPSGWTVAWQGDANDMTYNAETYTQDGVEWMAYEGNSYFTRQRWSGSGSYIELTQQLPLLPAGEYILKFQATAFGTNYDQSGTATGFVTVGSNTTETQVAIESIDPGTWSEYSIDFTLNTASRPTIGVRSEKLGDNFKTGYDHFTLTLMTELPDTGIGEAVSLSDKIIAVEYYNLQGIKETQPVVGKFYIKKNLHASKRTSVEKLIYTR
jgi:hypothetical protein